MPITNEILDEILKDYEKPEDLLSHDGLSFRRIRGLKILEISGF